MSVEEELFVSIASMADVPRRRARQHGARTALIHGERTTSFERFDRQCSHVANALIGAGVQPGERVAFLGKGSDWYFEILFGAAKARITTVPINTRLAAAEVASILEDCAAGLVFVDRQLYDVLEQALRTLARRPTVIVLGPASGAEQAYEAWRDAAPDQDPLIPVDPSDVFVQLYTSGTTGRPKGVMLAHRNWIAARRIQNDLRLAFNRYDDGDSHLIATPVSHIAGTGVGVNAIFCGLTNIVLPEFSASGVMHAVAAHKVRQLLIVPAALKQVLDHPEFDAAAFGSLRYLLYGASPIPTDLLNRAVRALPCGFVQIYGMTEACGSITYLPPEDHLDANATRLRSAGRPFEGIELKIVNGTGRSLAPLETGEICLRTAQCMPGYWNNPQATAATLDAEGWLHTGDAGYIDHDGYLYIHDRIKDVIVSGGENVYPAEVEGALSTHPAIADVAVIGVPDDTWGEAVKAVVVLKSSASATAPELIAHARERIAGFKCPKSIDFTTALPRNAGGKLLKRELRALYWQGRERQVN